MDKEKDKHNSSYALRPVWSAILNVYTPIAEILSRNGISHWVAYGTILGAARHKGFIPWDDDFDICVPNTQIDKAVEILKIELPASLKVITFDNTPEFEDTYVKVQETSSEIVERVEKESGTARPQGIYVDIFPIDGIPNGKLERMILRLKSILLFCVWNARFNTLSRRTWRYYISVLITLITAPFFSQISNRQDVQRVKKKWAKQYRFGNTQKCGRYVGGYRKNYPYEINTTCFSGTKYLDFEGIQVPVPERFEEYLTSVYGDWRKLPPMSEREMPSHEALSLAPWKFGPTQPVP